MSRYREDMTATANAHWTPADVHELLPQHRPRAVPVGHYLPLDVMTGLDEGLDEYRGVTERRRRLILGCLNSGPQIAETADDAHAAAAAAGGRLDHDGKIARRPRYRIAPVQDRPARRGGPAL